MRRWRNNLAIVSVVAIVCAVITMVITVIPVLRTVAALPLIFFLPGYAVMAACLPRQSLERVARFVGSVGVSIAIAILGSLLLYWLHISLQTPTWAIALAAITLIASAIAWRRQPVAEEDQPEPHLSIDLHWRDAALLAVAVFIVLGAIGIARLPTPVDSVSGYTSLWMIPARDGTSGSYELGISSQEFDAVTYHLQVLAAGRALQDWPELKLAPGETWTGSITLPSAGANIDSIEAVLYRQDNPGSAYRQVKLQPQR